MPEGKVTSLLKAKVSSPAGVLSLPMVIFVFALVDAHSRSHWAVHPSLSTVLPSSHFSLASGAPFPHTGVGAAAPVTRNALRG